MNDHGDRYLQAAQATGSTSQRPDDLDLMVVDAVTAATGRLMRRRRPDNVRGSMFFVSLPDLSSRFPSLSYGFVVHNPVHN